MPINLIVPAAGVGARLRPHTLHRPKPLMHVAGDVMLGHVLHSLAGARIDVLCLVVGHLGEQIVEYAEHVGASDLDPRNIRIVRQPNPLGQAHAVWQAREWLDGEALIAFPDTVLDVDLTLLGLPGTDGTLFAHKVDDPTRFGVVETDASDTARRLIEKPKDAASDLAVVGLYHVSNGRHLVEAIESLIDESSPDRGELYLLDALQRMIDGGARFHVGPVRSWADCGVPDDLLDANRKLLQQVEHNVGAAAFNVDSARAPSYVHPSADLVRCKLGPRVYIGPGCRIVDSTVGPDVSLAGQANIERSSISNSIAEVDLRAIDSRLDGCLLGAGVRVSGVTGALNLEDGSTASPSR